MKKFTFQCRVFLIAFLLLIGKISSGQTFNIWITNDHLNSPTELQFDVYFEGTSTTDFLIRTFQQSFTINPAFIPLGALPTVTFISGTGFTNSGGYMPGSILLNTTTPGNPITAFVAASNTQGTSCPGIGPVITPTTGPLLICSWKITSNSGPFNCVPHNLSCLRPADPLPSGVSIRWSSSKWNSTICSPPTNTIISNNGTYSTTLLSNNLVALMNNGAPQITNPVNASVSECPGQVATFSVTATSSTGITSSPVVYQWLENGVAISDGGVYSGTGTNQLTITNPTIALQNGKTYSCRVTQCGTRTSTAATLTVTACAGCSNPPTVNTGGPYVICSGSVNLNGSIVAASANTLTWSSPTGGTFSPNANTGNATYTPTNTDITNGSVTLTLTSDNPLGGTCVPDVKTVVVTINNNLVDDGNPCTLDGCDVQTGLPTHSNLTNIGGGATDGSACTSDDCSSGQTVYANLPTDDSNPCTTDGCLSTSGVFHTPLTNTGGGATDGNACTSDNCSSGQTVYANLPTDDSNPCTTDGCLSTSGVFHTPLTNTGGGATDGSACTSDNCSSGQTVYTNLPTDDSNPCTTDGCLSTSGVFHTPLTNTGGGATDGSACTSDNCSSGQTVYANLPTDDSNPCTTDGCLSTSGVFHTPLTNTGGGATDGSACTSDNCSSGQTVYTNLPTDDSNPCTTDGCLSTSGVFHTPLTNTGGGATDGSACTSDNCSSGQTVYANLPTDDSNPCTTDGCLSTSGVFHTPLTNTGGGATDGSACTSDNCSSGQTVYVSLPTDDSNPCTTDGCSSTSGVFHTPLTNTGGGATDGNACTSDNCSSGQTVYANLPTDDSNPCTTDGCLSTSGVFHTPLTNTGGGATDGSACTSDNCSSGQTVHVSLPTDDSNPCTTDGCLSTSGVFHTPLTNTGGGATDGNACTSDNCSSGQTVYANLPTDDSNPCTTDGCLSTSGVFHTPLTNTGGGATDGSACTSDNCSSGQTVHVSLPTDDSNPCTTDGCLSTSGVFHTPLTNTGGGATDGNACTSDNCSSGQTVYVTLPTEDNNPCTTDGCLSTSGVFHTPLTNTGGGATDGSACTSDNCSSGQTVYVSLPTDDSNPCTADGCSSTSGVFHTPLTNATGGASDNDPCTTDGCNSGVTVHVGQPSDDGNPCTADGCNSLGIFHTPLTNTNGGLSDNDPCTVDGCSSGVTTHTGQSSDDGNPCTADGCNSLGIFHTPLTNTDGGASDNNACTADGCLSGQTIHTAFIVDDNNPCTTDGCISTSGGVFHTPLTNNTGGLDDLNACTIDGCLSGQSVYSNVQVDDGNPCTADFCDPQTGVQHIPLTAVPPQISPSTVTDGNACTIDGCNQGVIYHNPLNTDDNNACTIDACNSLTGDITNTPLTPVQLSDGNPCTIDACDTQNGITHVADPNANADDDNACTVDACNTANGQVTHTPIAGIDDNDACTIDACNSASGEITHTSTAPTTSATISTPILCYGGTGCYNITASGGLPPYSISGTQFTTSTIICGVGVIPPPFSGLYYLLSDANGCNVIGYGPGLTEPPKLEVSTSTTPAGCSNNDGSATALATGGTPGYQYLWSPGSQTTATANNLAANTYSVLVTDANGCTKTVNALVASSNGGSLPAPGPFTGATAICKGQCLTYSVPAIPGATSYIWTLPNGATGNSSSNTITICFSSRFRSSGYLCVKAAGPCGNSQKVCYLIQPVNSKPSKPGPISGPQTVCPPTSGSIQQQYCVNPVAGASSYFWYVDHNSNPSLTIISGQGTPCVVVNIPAGYNGNQELEVQSVNCKGKSSDSEIDVKIYKRPSTPGSISGSSSVCKSQTKTFNVGNVSGATGYNWTVTGGAQIISGQGTNSIQVKFTTATSSSAVISVVATNPCFTSNPRTKTVSVNLNCKTSNESITDPEVIGVNAISVYPNPTSGKTTLSIKTLKDGKYNMRVFDVIGKMMINEDLSFSEGLNSKEIDLSDVTKGIYFVTIQSEEMEAQTLRIIVE